MVCHLAYPFLSYFVQAIDLGMNCNSDTWKMHGHPLFTAEETQIRRQIWWACVLTDRYGSIYMGLPFFVSAVFKTDYHC